MKQRDDERSKTPPFLLKLFYRTGAFHRPDEFAARTLPPHMTIYAWRSATLSELSHHVANHQPSLLPSPGVGTRLAFRLIYRDAKTSPRFVAKDIGSVVLRGGGGAVDPNVSEHNGDDAGDTAATEEADEPLKTLDAAKFIIGDYISCAILPSLDDGSVAPVSSARSGRGTAHFGAASAMRPWDDAGGPGPRAGQKRKTDWGGRQVTDGYVAGGTWSSTSSGRRGGGPRSGGFDSGGRGGGSIPIGEWKRGERLPDEPVGGRGGVGAQGGGGGWQSRNRGRW